MRLAALLDGIGLPAALAADQPWLAWARARDRAPRAPPLKAPQPKPPVALRPRQLSVTQIERWIANPYAIFASHILKLEPLADARPGARCRAERHDHPRRTRTLCRQHIRSSLPADVEAALLSEAQAVLAEYTGHPRVAAFWLPRFQRFANWFAETETERRAGVTSVAAEVSGRHVLAGPAGPFTLTARADRIDLAPTGLTLIDYKTGQPPSKARVESGASPQLPLEAAIAMADGFANVPPGKVSALAYIRVTGGEPPGEYKALDVADVAAVASDARAGSSRIDRTVRRRRRRPIARSAAAAFAAAYEFDDFAHLARVAEWSGGDDAGEV